MFCRLLIQYIKSYWFAKDVHGYKSSLNISW
jgi:hypothetical protein